MLALQLPVGNIYASRISADFVLCSTCNSGSYNKLESNLMAVCGSQSLPHLHKICSHEYACLTFTAQSGVRITRVTSLKCKNPTQVECSLRPEAQRLGPENTSFYSQLFNLPISINPRKHLCRSLDLKTLCRAASVSPLLDMVTPLIPEELDISLPRYDPANSPRVDLVVVGAGPAGLAVAAQVSSSGLQVCCIDPAPKSVWPNNYGVWVDEFEAMGLSDCLDYTWQKSAVYLDESKPKILDRPYGRVNRVRLKMKMMEKCLANGVTFYQSKVTSVAHDRVRSMVTCTDGACIDAAIILDATGFSRRLVEYEQPFEPGYQAAWGILAEVESHPFALDQMLFMDWRDSHLDGDPEMKRRNEELPTFLYAMPLSPTRIFLEETSLVARPAVKFREIQARLERRLEHLGIKVTKIEEDEYCLIPMGGVLPSIPQRVLGIGGTAGMVHPSTGYMVARTLAAAPELADAIVKRLKGAEHSSSSSSSREGGHARQVPPGNEEQVEERHASGNVPLGDEVAARVWSEVWPLGRREQREFFCFGMDVLLRLDLHGTRRFFDAFFDLSPFHWQGFLSSRLYLTELLGFGLSLFAHATNGARVEIVSKGIPGLGILIRNVVKLKLQSR